jgi:hypothetical protein
VVLAHDPARARWLKLAVASALESGADEVVVVRPYDSSLGDLDGRFRDVRTTEGPPGGKHAVGVESARCDVIAFLDDDDAWKPEKVGVVRERFGARDDLVLFNHGYDVIDDADRFVRPGTPLRGWWTLSSNLAVRRSWATPRTPVLRAAGWEADEVWVHLAEVDAPTGFEVSDRSLTRWRYHAGNVSRSHEGPSAGFRTAHARLYPRWTRAEEEMLRYARARSLPETSPVVRLRRRRASEFRFLAALEGSAGSRAAAREFLRGSEGTGRLRSLARLVLISPGLARYALYRFDPFRGT